MSEAPNTLQSLAIEFHAGSMTLQDVAEELMICGFCNFVDLKYAAEVVNRNKPTNHIRKPETMSEAPNLFIELPNRSATVDFPSVDGCKEATVTIERTEDGKLYIKIETNDVDDYLISTEEITIDLTPTEDA